MHIKTGYDLVIHKCPMTRTLQSFYWFLNNYLIHICNVLCNIFHINVFTWCLAAGIAYNTLYQTLIPKLCPLNFIWHAAWGQSHKGLYFKFLWWVHKPFVKWVSHPSQCLVFNFSPVPTYIVPHRQPIALAATQVILSTCNYISACSGMLRCHGDGSRGAFYLKTLINGPIYLTRMEPCKIHQGNETKIKYMPQDSHHTKPLWSSFEQCWQIGSLTCRGIIKWNLIKNVHWSTYTRNCLL